MPINLPTPKHCLIAQAANWFISRIDPIPEQDYLAAPLDVSHENKKLRDLYLTLRANDCDLRGRLMVEFSGHANSPQTPSLRIPMYVPPKKISDTRYINIDDHEFSVFNFKSSIIISNYFKLYDDDMNKYESILDKYYLSMDSVDNIFFENVTVDFSKLRTVLSGVEESTQQPDKRDAPSNESATDTKAAKPLSQHEQLTQSGPTRGRPREFDWDTIFREIVLLANTPDGLPETQADLERWVADKFIELFDKEPSASLIRKKIGPVYQRIRSKSQ